MTTVPGSTVLYTVDLYVFVFIVVLHAVCIQDGH